MYGDGLAINVIYTVDNPKKRAAGFKLSKGMKVPQELEGKFKAILHQDGFKFCRYSEA